jgi:hypothetical protein
MTWNRRIKVGVVVVVKDKNFQFSFLRASRKVFFFFWAVGDKNQPNFMRCLLFLEKREFLFSLFKKRREKLSRDIICLEEEKIFRFFIF